MSAPSSCLKPWLSAALLTMAGAAAATGDAAVSTPLMYRLVGDPLAEQSLLATRWALPTLSLRLDAAAGLGAHELRILGDSVTPTVVRPISLFGAETERGYGVDPLRATYRYTLLAEPHWQMKVGLSTNLRNSISLQPESQSADAQRFGSLPLLHVAGVGQWSPRWRLGFALDGLMTARGRAVDLGVQVDYLWSPSMHLYGGYQMTDAAGEAEGYYGSGLNNRARIGLRLRF